jgi:heme/copper-type cytochrome/quinol oxidase subunit 2
MSPEQNQPGYGTPPPPPGPPGYGGGGGGGGYGGGNPIHRQASNGMAITALVLGIIGLISSVAIFGGVLGLIAIVLGFMARGKVKRGESTAGGMALAGIITGFFAVIIAGIVLAIAVFFADQIGSLTECLEKAGNDPVAEAECERDFQSQFE